MGRRRYPWGGDCEPLNDLAYPDAEEAVNGVIEDCSLGGLSDAELDIDGDGFVTCEILNIGEWEGDPSIVGGSDCNDNQSSAYPGAAYISDPNECMTDLDGDGTQTVHGLSVPVFEQRMMQASSLEEP